MNEERKYGLKITDIDSIISILKKNDKIKKAVLFGSRAMGNYRNGSDIDIALDGNDLNINDLLVAYAEIEELSLPYKFDLVIIETINEEKLLEHITNRGKILLERQ